jgi:hypothetical protein
MVVGLGLRSQYRQGERVRFVRFVMLVRFVKFVMLVEFVGSVMSVESV